MKEEIERLIETLKGLDPNSDEYSYVMLHLEKLTEIQSKTGLRQEVIFVEGLKIVSLLMVLYFEKTDAVISKAFGMIRFK